MTSAGTRIGPVDGITTNGVVCVWRKDGQVLLRCRLGPCKKMLCTGFERFEGQVLTSHCHPHCPPPWISTITTASAVRAD